MWCLGWRDGSVCKVFASQVWGLKLTSVKGLAWWHTSVTSAFGVGVAHVGLWSSLARQINSADELGFFERPCLRKTYMKRHQGKRSVSLFGPRSHVYTHMCRCTWKHANVCTTCTHHTTDTPWTTHIQILKSYNVISNEETFHCQQKLEEPPHKGPPLSFVKLDFDYAAEKNSGQVRVRWS